MGAVVGTFITGSLYTLIAVGLSLLWSTMNFANFGHGAILVIGAYVAWYFAEITGLLPFIFLSIPVTFLLGVFFDYLIFRKLRHYKDAVLRSMLASLTMLIIIERVLFLIFGGYRRYIPPLIKGNIVIGNITIFNQHILASIIAIITLIILYLILTRTVTGIAIKAAGQNIQESLIVGVNVNRIYSLTMGLGFTLAGIAGMLLGSMYIFDVTFGRTPQLIGYVIAVLGGIGNIKGTIYSSYLIAAIESLTIIIIGGGWRLAIPYLIMIAILVLKPHGLFGIKEEVR
ncbi:MAG: branched-chain amino acid ABC transporter permease [Nitrososphaerota archaeon]